MKNQADKPIVLYIAPVRSSFVRNDIELLSADFRVKVSIEKWSLKYAVPFFLVRQFIWLLLNMPKAKAVVVSFGGYWSFFPALLGRILNVRVFIILNGTDSASLPALNYGDLRKPILKKVLHWSYLLASELWPVSESLIYGKLNYGDLVSPAYIGVKYFFPKLKTPYKEIPNAVNGQYWSCENKAGNKRSNQFLTVLSPGQFTLKGGNFILELAESFADYVFYFAGIEAPQELQNIPGNVVFTGRMKPEELKALYEASHFYLQLSLFEGFGVALCEAMLCECIPIGSEVNFIPQIIGETGLVLEKEDVLLFRKKLEELSSSKDYGDLGKEARKRVESLFSCENRLRLMKSSIQG